MKRLTAAAGLMTVMGLRNASAQPAQEDVHIEVRVAEGCPPESWVLGRIGGRTDRFRQVAKDRASRTFLLEIKQSGVLYTGSLEITELEPAPRSTSRRIEGARCEDVADGLALIAALTIDPRAKLEAVDTKPAEAKPPVPEKPAAPPPPEPKPKPPPSPTAVPYFEIGAGVIGMSGAAPALLYGGEGFLEAGWLAPHRWFSPGLRVGFRHARRDGVSFEQGTAFFGLSAVAADFCPVRAPIPTVGLRLCATGEFGWFEAQGLLAAEPQQSTRGWAALGGAFRASASTSRIGVELSFGAEAPLRRDRFFLESQVGEVSAVVLYAGLAVTGRIY